MQQPKANHEAKAAIERAYPLPDGFLQRTQRTLSALQQQKEFPIMKKRLTFAAALSVLLLGITGALALTQWGVLDFLFHGTQRDDLQAYTQKLDLTKTVDDVRLTIDSAFYDGETFAMDWTIENTNPDRPVFLQVDAFSVGEHRLRTDGNDSFDSQWLPGVFGQDGTMQDGERMTLPVEKLQGDTQPVQMRVGIYRPTKPLYWLPSQYTGEDLDEAAQDALRLEYAKTALEKMAEGALVLWDDTFAIADDEAEHGVAFAIGDIRAIWPEDAYTVTHLDVSFDLNVRAARAAIQPLPAQDTYTFDIMTTRYERALRTPSGVALTLTAKPLPGQEQAFEAIMEKGSWEATDGAGAVIEKWPDEFMSTGWTFEDGTFGRQVTLSLSLTQAEMPEQISISYLSEGGTAIVSPVSTSP